MRFSDEGLSQLRKDVQIGGQWHVRLPTMQTLFQIRRDTVMIQQCRHCRDFYRMDDDDMAMENDDGALVSDVCRQCSDEFKHAERALDEAWHLDFQQLDNDF